MLLIASVISVLKTILDFEKFDFVLPLGLRSDILTSPSGRRAVRRRLIHVFCRTTEGEACIDGREGGTDSLSLFRLFYLQPWAPRKFFFVDLQGQSNCS